MTPPSRPKQSNAHVIHGCCIVSAAMPASIKHPAYVQRARLTGTLIRRHGLSTASIQWGWLIGVRRWRGLGRRLG